MPPHRQHRAGVTPTPSDDFVGRDRELELVATLLLRPARLITVIGSGGIGKTRLAAESTYRVHRARRVPVHWVSLSRLAKGAGADAVESEVVQSVVDADFSGRSAWQALVESLDRVDAVGNAQQTILVFDNCEHVLSGAGAVIAELIDAVPGLTVLATSREPIRWADEQLVQIPPLTRHQALALFVRRAELTGHTVAEDQAKTIETICDHLHNYPLHIRLAAARLRRQPLSAILSDLSGELTDRRLRWSPSRHLNTDERHHGIGDVIAWSFELCGTKERLLFERMSVFAAGYDGNPDDTDEGWVLGGGTDLEAVIAVCSDTDGGLVPDEIEELLERLTDQSLVTVHLTADVVRYSLLESLRVFAQQRLFERDGNEQQRLTARHRRYYRDKIVAAGADWFNSNEQQLLDWARLAWDNLLLAMDSSLTTASEAVVGLEIATGMISLRVPFFKGSLRESRRWAERTLDATAGADPQPVDLQISAMASIAWLSLCQGLPDEAERMLDRCIALCLPDDGARAALRLDPTVDVGLPAPVEFASGAALMLVHSDVRALTILTRAREKFTEAGHGGGAAMSELFEALAAAFLGTVDQALEITRRHLDRTACSGAEWARSWAEMAWVIAQTKYGDPEGTLVLGRAALARQVATRDHWGAVWAVHTRAWALARLMSTEQNRSSTRIDSRAVEVARLLGGAAALRYELGVEITYLSPFAAETDKAAEITRKRLGHNAFEAAWQEGSALRPALDMVTGLALGTLSLDKLSADRSRRLRADPWPQLSKAEQEVAVLAAAGWTNSAIAARRGSSHRTVDAQIAAILKKLMISSRVEIPPLVPADYRDRITRERKRRPRRARSSIRTTHEP